MKRKIKKKQQQIDIKLIIMMMPIISIEIEIHLLSLSLSLSYLHFQQTTRTASHAPATLKPILSASAATKRTSDGNFYNIFLQKTNLF